MLRDKAEAKYIGQRRYRREHTAGACRLKKKQKNMFKLPFFDQSEAGTSLQTSCYFAFAPDPPFCHRNPTSTIRLPSWHSQVLACAFEACTSCLSRLHVLSSTFQFRTRGFAMPLREVSPSAQRCTEATSLTRCCSPLAYSSSCPSPCLVSPCDLFC
ncbi:hypothetical protein L226DRAFT_284721 [Lentinus tigrinus ALCF2SS1-7]|uniref:uncharacterized protein n=1 Tax=Lentinus tigrinus ALCF2SS1-7 TaxID=1328758 RepID=UPI001165C8AE|nr:hypothetical protein L226DRAFT_284721 [Lentinus tigrinus ALCF2SS1-7]